MKLVKNIYPASWYNKENKKRKWKIAYKFVKNGELPLKVYSSIYILIVQIILNFC